MAVHKTLNLDKMINLTDLKKLINNKSYLIFGSDLILEQSDISIYKNIYDDLKQVTGGFFAQNRIQLNDSSKLIFFE